MISWWVQISVSSGEDVLLHDAWTNMSVQLQPQYLTVQGLTGTVRICFPGLQFRQRGAPHDIHPQSLTLFLWRRTAGYSTEIKETVEHVIWRGGARTHWNQVRTSGDLHQNHRVTEEWRGRRRRTGLHFSCLTGNEIWCCRYEVMPVGFTLIEKSNRKQRNTCRGINL